ncbi:MAG: mechanosensitive ion channel [Sterolibacteriaceae bacterium]|nr:mechanosensitive ion channel [Sterolibacteriaceae bacterium]MBK9085694.1 mechanosensitive ion channel [Sterolibacteriaceae bacterium]
MASLGEPGVIGELSIIALCVAVAFLIARYVRSRRIADAHAAGRVAELGRRSVRRLTFPLAGIVLLLFGRGLAHLSGLPTQLFANAIALLAAMALIRMAVFALRTVFAPSGWLASFERGFAAIVWVLFALHVLGILPDVVAWMESVEFSVGAQNLSVWLVLQGAVTVLITVLAALWLSGLLETRLMASKELNASLKAVFSRLAKALLLLLAVLIALPMVGLDLTTLSVFGGALGVGLGFGMQKIASNYVSGFIILLDRSIQIGNMITVDRFRGEVLQINTRYSVLRSLTGVESIVPNEMLIASVVENETYTNPRVRISMPVQISYQSDLDLAMQIMTESARAQPRVLAEPPPQAFVGGFADSGINLELGLWIGDPQEGTLGVRSAINLRIWREFKRQGVEIPYPQREVRLLDAPGAAPASPQG